MKLEYTAEDFKVEEKERIDEVLPIVAGIAAKWLGGKAIDAISSLFSSNKKPDVNALKALTPDVKAEIFTKLLDEKDVSENILGKMSQIAQSIAQTKQAQPQQQTQAQPVA